MAGASPLLQTLPELGARRPAGTESFNRSPAPIGTWGFLAVAVCSFGGPLALAALGVPGLLADASASSALALIAGVVVFGAPLMIWLRYSRHIASSGGLYSFVEAAAGRRVALLQAAVWIVSYALYLVYTTVQIVYDLLPNVFPGVRGAQTLLALAIPVAIVALMVAGRAATLVVLGMVAAGQLALAGVLDGLTLSHFSTPATVLAAGAPAGSLAKAGAQTSLLYVCGSLPLFLGGELRRPARTIRLGLVGSYIATALVVALAVVPLAASPGLLRTSVPGLTVAQQFASPALARTIGVGIAASVGAVIVCEYLALTRLVHAIGGWRLRPIALGIGMLMILAAPLTLINPDGLYTALIKPSLVALWLSQLIVFVVYPRFAVRRGARALPAWLLGGVASGLAVYGLWTAVAQASS